MIIRIDIYVSSGTNPQHTVFFGLISHMGELKPFFHPKMDDAQSPVKMRGYYLLINSTRLARSFQLPRKMYNRNVYYHLASGLILASHSKGPRKFFALWTGSVQPVVPWKMRLEMLVGMQIGILNGGEILVTWSKSKNSKISVSCGTNSNWDFGQIWISLYLALQIQIQILV